MQEEEEEEKVGKRERGPFAPLALPPSIPMRKMFLEGGGILHGACQTGEFGEEEGMEEGKEKGKERKKERKGC